jgi:hypothetical protein
LAKEPYHLSTETEQYLVIYLSWLPLQAWLVSLQDHLWHYTQTGLMKACHSKFSGDSPIQPYQPIVSVSGTSKFFSNHPK